MLAEKGGAVNSGNNGWMTPLIQACINQNSAIVDYLLKTAVYPNQGVEGTDCFKMVHRNDIIVLLKAAEGNRT